MRFKIFIWVIAYLIITGANFNWNLQHFVDHRSTHLLNNMEFKIHNQAANLNTQVLALALKAYSHAQYRSKNIKHILTIIDFSKPSTERRLWVIDLHKQKVLYNTWVTHGKNSGHIKANSFSNKPGSLKSSLGVFLTGKPYIGSVGYALHLTGLESGFNDNAYRRSVVVHGAWYANPNVLSKYGQLGRSFGCPAVSDTIAKSLINTIKDRALVFAYYPDRKWLEKSMFLA